MEPKMFSNQKVIIKAGIITALTFALLMPAFLIEKLVEERKQRQEQVSAEVGKKWGLPQTLSGFVLAIPYNTESKTSDGRTISLKNYYVLQPRKHNLSAGMQVQLRKRSIYEVPLYDVTAHVNDVFSNNGQQTNLPGALKTTEAMLCLQVTDKKGISGDIEATLNGRPVTLNTEISLPGFDQPLLAGVADLSPFTDSNDIMVNSTYSVKGSGSLYFYPNAKHNHVEIRSPWKHPSFQGYEVPDSNRVDKKGFVASWDAPQQTDAIVLPSGHGRDNVTGNVFGLAVIQPADSYTKTLRTVKYAILVIVLSFSVFFITELVKRIPVHALQYILVGAALVIFYTLLLAISEYTSYNPAYVIAALATVLLIGFYTAGIYRSISLGLAFTLFMGILYTFIFVMIQLEDNALLFGSIGLFAVVASGMYVTRKMNARLTEITTNTQ